MRWSGAALLAAACALGACRQKPPEVPPALSSALGEARQAVSVGTPARVRTACEQLTVHLMDLARTHPRGDDLRALAGEVNELGHTALPALQARDAFAAIDGRLTQALAGEKPAPGPRLRLDAPVAVREAVTLVDDAFHRWELGEACDGIDQTTMRLSQWRWEDPAPPRAEKLQAALDVLDPMPLSCRAGGVQAAQQQWERAVASLAPGVE